MQMLLQIYQFIRNGYHKAFPCANVIALNLNLLEAHLFHLFTTQDWKIGKLKTFGNRKSLSYVDSPA